MPRASIRAVLLDADGVVQLPRPGWQAALEALCGIPDRTDEFLADLFAAEKSCLTGDADFERTLANVLRKWGARVSIQDALQIWTQIEPSAEMLAAVRALRSAGVSVSLATNQQAYRAAYMTGALGYADLFDHVLYSCELGHAKPNAEYFSAALARINCAPDQALFIDDHEAHISAARDCGLHAEVFHVSQGMGRFQELLRGFGVTLA